MKFKKMKLRIFLTTGEEIIYIAFVFPTVTEIDVLENIGIHNGFFQNDVWYSPNAITKIIILKGLTNEKK